MSLGGSGWRVGSVGWPVSSGPPPPPPPNVWGPYGVWAFDDYIYVTSTAGSVPHQTFKFDIYGNFIGLVPSYTLNNGVRLKGEPSESNAGGYVANMMTNQYVQWFDAATDSNDIGVFGVYPSESMYDIVWSQDTHLLYSSFYGPVVSFGRPYGFLGWATDPNWSGPAGGPYGYWALGGGSGIVGHVPYSLALGAATYAGGNITDHLYASMTLILSGGGVSYQGISRWDLTYPASGGRPSGFPTPAIQATGAGSYQPAELSAQMLVDDSLGYLYQSTGIGDQVNVIALPLTTGSVNAATMTNGVGTYGTGRMAFGPGNKLFWIGGGAGQITVFDRSSFAVLHTIDLTTWYSGAQPWDLSVSPDGTKLAVTDVNENYLYIINAGTYAFEAIATSPY